GSVGPLEHPRARKRQMPIVICSNRLQSKIRVAPQGNAGGPSLDRRAQFREHRPNSIRTDHVPRTKSPIHSRRYGMNAVPRRRPSGRPSSVPATLTLGLAVALLAMVSLAPPAAAGVKPPQVKLDFEKYTLPNGLEVILREDHRLPIVAVNTWYHVGPANEEVGRTGFAHLFEHMMFQSSGHVGEDEIWKDLEGAGASFINGTTDFDRTNYMEDLPSNQLELALWLESDRMGFLQDRLDAASLANQKDVVRNERRQSVENAPYQLPEEEMYHLLYPKGHPYYAWVIGSHEDIQAAKIDDVK